MTQLGEYVKSGSAEAFPEYDFEKISKTYVCDEISSDSNLMIVVVKVLAVAIIAVSIASLFFIGAGATSFVAPLGITNSKLILWDLTKIATYSTFASVAPVCFLSNALFTLNTLKDHYFSQISLAENHKIKLIAGTASKSG